MKRHGLLLLYGFVLLALYICPLAVEAQDYVYATGNPNFGVNYPVSAGQVDITNGNVHLSIPLGSFAQRGGLPPININLEYDSRIWKIVENNGSYSWQPINVPNSMDGWRLTTGLEQGTTSYNEYFEQNSQTATCKVNGLYVYDFSESWTLINGFSWKDSEGTNHVFEAQTEQPVQVCDGDTNYTHPTASGYATDGSGLFVEITNYTQMVIYDNTGNEVYPVRKDPNGNTVTIDASGTITDSMGRVLLTTTTSGSTITYNVIKEGGGTNTYTVQTEPVQLSTSFAQQAVSEFTGSLTSIQSIGLPDGHSYSFTYDSGTAAGNYGELGTMALPTGGVSSLSYINYTDSYNNANRWISTETEDNKIVSFAPQVISQCSSGTVGCVEQMTMTRPAGDYRVYTLTMNNGAWDGQTDIYQGTSKLVTIKNNYDFSHSCSSSSICTGAEYITASSSSVTLDDTGQVANTLYTYAAPWIGKVSSVQEFDYGVSGTPSRETDYTYGYTINGAYLLTQESSLYKGAAFGLKVYGYDYAANVLKETRGLSGQAQAITTYTYDGNGMKTSEIDPNNNTTTFQYSCNDGFLSQTTYPQTGSVAHIEKVAPDCSSGYPLSKTDENNQIVTYEYDSIGRKSSITYPTGGGSTTYSYPSATEVDETKLISSGVSSTSVTTWDSYGKKSETSDTDPAGSDSIQYTYDLNNRLASTTNAQRTTPQPTDGKTQYVYDALDRVTLITQPDGQKIQISYSGNQDTVTDENGHQRRHAYDAFHNLESIWEPNSTGTPSWETDYQTDPSKHLISVSQLGDQSSAPRVRTFVYDSLGNLLSESVPESGTTSFTYDANGNTKTRTDARGLTVTWNYDALNRKQSEVASDNSVNNTFTYDNTSNGSFGVGKLFAAQGIGAGTEMYYDAMGRITAESYLLPGSGTWQYGTSATYDYAGDLTSLTYPDGRVVTQSYDSAKHLTGIQYSSWGSQTMGTSYYNATAFAPAGQTQNATYGNGITRVAAFNSRQNLSTLNYANSTQTLWSKQYTWASNGKNLLQIADLLNSAQTYSYTYDPDDRLATANGGGQTLVSSAVAATGSVSITGTTDGVYAVRNCSGLPGQPIRCTTSTYYDYGVVTLTVGSSSETASYSQYSTPTSIALALATAVNQDASCPVTASASGSTVNLTSKLAGSAYDYSLSASSATNDTQYFTQASFGTSTSGSSLTGGTNAVYSGADQLAETYSADPWGNQQSSGNFSFMQTFAANNQVSGYNYDAAGDQIQDRLGNTYTYDALGQETASNSATFVYDAMGLRVQKSGGSYPSQMIYFNGIPVARYDTSSASWTDLIWAGGSIIAEVPGSQSAVPTYRLLDHEGTLVATANGSGGVTGTTVTTPYGQVMASSTSDPYLYTGLPQDTENATDDAQYRNYSTEQTRWLRPDPYNGSYDPYNPQSFNRYMYVNGNPLGFVDPSGLTFGILNGVGGGICKADSWQWNGTVPIGNGALGINPCNPVGSLIADGVVAAVVYAEYAEGAIKAVSYGKALLSFKGSDTYMGTVAAVGAAITVFCSVHHNNALCGPTGGISYLIGGDVGKVVNDSLSVGGAVACLAVPGGWGCLGDAIYQAINGLLTALFGPPQFTGSLLPRPSDLGGLGTAPIGIPNQNLSVQQLLGSAPKSKVPSPGMVHP